MKNITFVNFSNPIPMLNDNKTIVYYSKYITNASTLNTDVDYIANYFNKNYGHSNILNVIVSSDIKSTDLCLKSQYSDFIFLHLNLNDYLNNLPKYLKTNVIEGLI